MPNKLKQSNDISYARPPVVETVLGVQFDRTPVTTKRQRRSNGNANWPKNCVYVWTDHFRLSMPASNYNCNSPSNNATKLSKNYSDCENNRCSCRTIHRYRITPMDQE